MLSPSEINQLLTLRKDTTTFFSRLPNDVVDLIGGLGYDPHPHSDIAEALRHAALGTKKDIAIVVERVKKIPSVITPSGGYRDARWCCCQTY